MKNSGYLFGLAAVLIVGAMTVNSFNSVTSNPSSAAEGAEMRKCITAGVDTCNSQDLQACEMGNCMRAVVTKCRGIPQSGDSLPVDCSNIGAPGSDTGDDDGAGASAIDEVVWTGTVTDSNGVSDEILISASGQVVSSDGGVVGSCMREEILFRVKPLSCDTVKSILNSCNPAAILSSMCGGASTCTSFSPAPPVCGAVVSDGRCECDLLGTPYCPTDPDC